MSNIIEFKSPKIDDWLADGCLLVEEGYMDDFGNLRVFEKEAELVEGKHCE